MTRAHVSRAPGNPAEAKRRRGDERRIARQEIGHQSIARRLARGRSRGRRSRWRCGSASTAEITGTASGVTSMMPPH